MGNCFCADRTAPENPSRHRALFRLYWTETVPPADWIRLVPVTAGWNTILGEEGKEESTGYLFLEFWKEDSGEYRTIGIGQKAKRGKPMDFWGFVILDGRRVGYDLWLYKEVGSNKIPRDKREMKAELGEDNFSQTARRNIRSMSTSIFSVS